MCNRCKRGTDRDLWHMAAPRDQWWCTACVAAITWGSVHSGVNDWGRANSRYYYARRVRWHTSHSNPLEAIHGQLIDLTIDPASYGRVFTDQNAYVGVGPYDTISAADRG